MLAPITDASISLLIVSAALDVEKQQRVYLMKLLYSDQCLR
jgi:hypothetical protein